MKQTALTSLSQLSPPWQLTSGGPDHLLYQPSNGEFVLLLQNPWSTQQIAAVDVFTGDSLEGDADAGGVQFGIVLDPGVIGMLSATVAAPSRYKVSVGYLRPGSGERRVQASRLSVAWSETAKANILSLPFGLVSVAKHGGVSFAAKTWEMDGTPSHVPPSMASATYTTVYRPEGSEVSEAVIGTDEPRTKRRYGMNDRLWSWATASVVAGLLVAVASVVNYPDDIVGALVTAVILGPLLTWPILFWPAPISRLLGRGTEVQPPFIIGGPVQGLNDHRLSG